MHNSSFSDRILISDSKMRHLILKYIKSGLTDEEIADLFRYCHSKCTFLMKLMNHLESLSTPQRLTSKLHQCPSHWRNFIHSIGSSSAVCALIPPNEKSIAIINQLCDEDILTNPEVLLSTHTYLHYEY